MMTCTPATDVYLAPLHTPHVESIVDDSGHLLRIPDHYRWAGVLWQPDPDQEPAVQRSYRSVWITMHLRRPDVFRAVVPDVDTRDVGTTHHYFRALTVTRLEEPDQLVWNGCWLPRAELFYATGPDLVTIAGSRDPALDTECRQLLAGPGMTDPTVRALLGLTEATRA